MTGMFGEAHAELTYFDGIEKLLRSTAESVLAVSESGDSKRISKWLIANAAQKNTSKSRFAVGERIEAGHASYEGIGLDGIVSDVDLTDEIVFDQIQLLELAELLTRLGSDRAREVVMLRCKTDQPWSEIALKLRVSKQAAQQMFDRAVAKMRSDWQKLHSGVFCRELQSRLASVSWRVEHLGDDSEGTARAHLKHCSLCAMTLDLHERSLAGGLSTRVVGATSRYPSYRNTTRE